MSEAPISDPEKNSYPSDSKALHHDATPVYVDEALGESEVVEFGETRELK